MKDKLKVLAINGSPHAEGGTFQAINIVAKELEKFNIETEILQIGNKVIQGCRGCGTCKKGSTNGLCVFNNDEVNLAIEKMKTCDGIILGSPVYYAGINGTMKSFLDRFFYAGASSLRHKVATSVVSVRRAGGVATFDQLNHFLYLAEALIVPSIYWNVVHGTTEDAIQQDKEGLQILENLGQNMAWLLKMREATKDSLAEPSPIASKTRTSFIR